MSVVLLSKPWTPPDSVLLVKRLGCKIAGENSKSQELERKYGPKIVSLGQHNQVIGAKYRNG